MEGLGPSAARQYKSLHGCILLFFSILGGTRRLFNLTGTPPQEQFQDVSIEAKYLQHRVARLELGPCSPHDKAVVRYDLPYCGTRLWYPPRLTTARPSGIQRLPLQSVQNSWADRPSRQNCQNMARPYFEATKCAEPPKVPEFQPVFAVHVPIDQ